MPEPTPTFTYAAWHIVMCELTGERDRLADVLFSQTTLSRVAWDVERDKLDNVSYAITLLRRIWSVD
mgnify:CR=1 FL=1